MNEKEIQQAFIQFLAQKYQLKSQQELEAKIQELGEKGLKAEYAEFQKVIEQQQSRKMMFGAKLNYIKGLKGQCPQGYEMKYYKDGGRVCAKCEAIKQQAPMNLIDAFKCGRRMKKKACGGSVRKDKEGGSAKPSKTVKTVKTVTTYPNKLENQQRVVQYFDDGTQAVINGGWGTDGMFRATLRGRRGEFGNTAGTPRQQQIADSLERVDWRQLGWGPIQVPALKKTSRTK